MSAISKATEPRATRPRLTPQELQALYDNAGPDDSGETQEETDARMAGGLVSPPGTQPREIVAALRARRRGERGPQKAPTLERIGLRIGQDVVARWRATGDGWQTRMAEWVARGPA